MRAWCGNRYAFGFAPFGFAKQALCLAPLGAAQAEVGYCPVRFCALGQCYAWQHENCGKGKGKGHFKVSALAIRQRQFQPVRGRARAPSALATVLRRVKCATRGKCG